MTLDEAIKHCEEVAEAEERSAKLHRRPDRGVKGSGKRYLSCLECASEHRQLASWLMQLKRIKENVNVACVEFDKATDHAEREEIESKYLWEIERICREGGKEWMSNLEKAKEVIKEHYDDADCGIFNTRNIVGDPMETIYNNDDFRIDICYGYAYYEVFGLSDEEFEELCKYYHELGKEYEGGEC